MSRYKSRGKPKVAPTTMHKVNGEPWKARHGRRLGVAMHEEGFASLFCEQHKIAFKITNNGHHWQFRREEWKADWWPVSAHLVLNQAWAKGIHCQDVRQVVSELRHHGWANEENFKRYQPEDGGFLTPTEMRDQIIHRLETPSEIYKPFKRQPKPILGWRGWFLRVIAKLFGIYIWASTDLPLEDES